MKLIFKKLQKIRKIKIYGLINNAAINPIVEKQNTKFNNFETLNFSQWQNEINVGINGAFYVLSILVD